MVGVPARVAVPLWLSVKVTPVGRLDQPHAGAGYPPAVAVKLNADPTVPVAVVALVNAGAWPTTRVNVCVAAGVTPLLAVIVNVVVPVAVGVPEMSAMPVPSSRNVRPAGNVPVSVITGVGEPVAVMATAPAALNVKSATAPLVMMGAAAALMVMARPRVDVATAVAFVAVIVTG